jgi:hypothetical protein
LAHVRFYPVRQAETDDQVMVYDVAESAAFNRTLGGKLVDLRRRERGGSPMSSAGAPLVVVQGEELGRDNSDFVWSPEGQSFAFLDHQNERARVVRVDVNGPRVVQSVFAFEITSPGTREALTEANDQRLLWAAGGLEIQVRTKSISGLWKTLQTAKFSDLVPVPQPE